MHFKNIEEYIRRRVQPRLVDTCIHKKYNFETGPQRTPVENKKRGLDETRSRDGDGSEQ